MAQPYFADYPVRPYLATTHRSTMDQLAATIRSAMTELAAYLEAKEALVLGAPFVRYREIDMGNGVDIEIGFPVDAPETVADEAHQVGQMPAGRYAVYDHRGAPNTLLKANKTLLAFGLAEKIDWDLEQDGSLERWGGRFEHQLVGPDEAADPEQWMARIAYLCR